jgi:(p)ppGpp synthase/HD superfamily hydrolase
MTTSDFKQWCKERHDIYANQKYDENLPYSKHLEFVEAHFHRFKHLIGKGWVDYGVYDAHTSALMGCWGHDLIEDARITYNNIKDMVGKEVADIIYCCTEEKGRDRDERHSEKYYTELAVNRLAVFVKLCDIMANATYSILTKSSMYAKHKKEHEKSKKYLYGEDYKLMFDYLDRLFELW